MVPSTRSVFSLAVAGMVIAAGAAIAQGASGLAAETLAQSTPLFAFQNDGNRGAIVFQRSGSAQEHDPRLFVAARDGWRLVQLPDELHNTSWVFAGRSATRYDEIWGITQGSAEEQPGRTLLFVSSANGGRSWRLRGALQKISRYAVVDMFSVNEDGKGTLVLRLDDDPEPEAPRLGYYLYLTKNGGRNWSEAIYSQSRPQPPTATLLPAGRTFDGQKPLDPDAWERLFVDLQPAE
jgi:hypothetical protein